jgi:hypothetical protein
VEKLVEWLAAKKIPIGKSFPGNVRARFSSS